MEDYSIQLDIRIDWSEVDLFGHVNNLSIMKYVQAARINLLETIGLMQLQAEIKKGPILASIHCQFRKPLFYPGQVSVYSGTGLIKNTSFEIHHALYDYKHDLAAQAKDIIVFFDSNENQKIQIPEWLRERIEKLEKKNK